MAVSYKEARKAFDDLARTLENTVRKEQDRILRIYAEVYDEIIDRIRKIYKKYADKDSSAITNADKTTINRLRSIGDQCAHRLDLAHNRVQQILDEDCREIYGESFFHTAYEIDRQISEAGFSVNWGLIPHSAAEIAALDDYAMLAGSKTFQMAANKSVSAVQEIFSKAIIRGDSLEKVRDALISKLGVNSVSAGAARYVGSGISAWAMMVARTEMFRAFSLAQSRAERICEENNLNLDWIWLATLDSRTRPAHGALDGQKKDKERGGWYSPAVGWVKGPHQSGVPSFDINCRCTVMAIYNGEMPAERYERGRGVVSWKTYDQWKLEQEVLSNPITASDGIEVKEISWHAVKRFNDRDIKLDYSYLEDALKHPYYITDEKADEEGRISKRYVGKWLTVGVNPYENRITTVWKTGRRTRKRYEN